MSKEVTKEQIGSIVALLVAGKVPHDDAQAFIDKYKNVPSKKKRKAMKPKEGSGGGVGTTYEDPNVYRFELTHPSQYQWKDLGGGKGVEFKGRVFGRHPSRYGNVQAHMGLYSFRVEQIPKSLMRDRVSVILNDFAKWAETLHCKLAVEIEAITFADSRPKLPKGQRVFVLGSSLDNDRYMGLVPAPNCDRIDHDFYQVGGLSETHRVLLIKLED